MPSAVEYIPPNANDRNAFTPAVEREYRERKTFYENSLKYYKGDATAPFKVDPDDPDYDPATDNTVINLVKMAAERTASFLFPELPEIQTDPESIEDTIEEKWLKEVFFVANGGLHTLVKWALRGFLSGHTFIWVKNSKPVPKIALLHPLSVTAFWAADDMAEILWYEQRYYADKVVYIRDFVKQEDDTWVIYLYKGDTRYASDGDKVIEQIGNQGNTFAGLLNFDSVAFGSNYKLVSKAVHGSTTPPILNTPHLPDPDSFYGMGEFTEKDLLDIINKIASERTRIIRENADPLDVVTGANPAEVSGDGGFVTIANPNAKVNRLALTSDLHAVNGTLEHLIEQFLGIMRVVILKGEAKDLQRVTNAAVRTLFLDALAKNGVLWASYSNTVAQMCKLALEYAYANSTLVMADPKDIRVKVKMASPLPTDLTEIANINALAIAGKYMSPRTAATQLGLDFAFESAGIEKAFEKGLEQQEKTMALASSFEKEDSPPNEKSE